MTVSNICLCILIFAVTATTSELCDLRKCPSIPKHYDEIGCKPIKQNGDCCVTSYDCPELQGRDNSKCYFKNQTLIPGEVLEGFQQSDTCESKCYCNLNRGGGSSEMVCSRMKCPTEKYPIGKHAKHCLKQYKPDGCCPVKSVCDEDINKLATCVFEGKTYREGERMFPRQHCYKCFCAKNFDNSTSVPENKNCHKIDCGIALTKTARLSEGCIPVYIKTDDCCPIGWRCPGDKHMNVDVLKHKPNKQTCRFGNMYLKVGESLDLGGDDMSCTCTMPPMLHCVIKQA